MSDKKVCLIVEVPNGDFCWDSKSEICSYFDNYGGSPSCGLKLAELRYDSDFIVRKPPECINLKEV